MALGGDEHSAKAFADARWGLSDASEMVFKAAVSASSTANSGDIVEPSGAARAFWGRVRERSALGRLGLRRVAPRVPGIKPIDDAFSAQWRGEGAARPVRRAKFEDVTELRTLDLGVILVATRELLTSGDTRAEAFLLDEAEAAIAAELDRALLDPANAGVPDVRPASLLHGATSETGDPDDVTSGLQAAIAAFEGDLSRAVLVMHPVTAATIAASQFSPTLGARGGALLGIPALTTRHASEDRVALIDPKLVALVDEPGEIASAAHASIEMTDGADADLLGNSVTPTDAELVSLFQTNSKALMVTARVNWLRASPAAVVVLNLEAS